MGSAVRPPRASAVEIAINQPDLLDPNAVTIKCNFSLKTLNRLVALGQFPQPLRFGRARRWRAATIEAHLRKLESQAEAAVRHASR